MLRHVLGAAIVFVAAKAGAQRVPGRDLLNFPLGLSGEPAALGDGAASGLWNPATGLLGAGTRSRIALSALSAPIDVALSGQAAHAAVPLKTFGTISLGITRAAIQQLVHTETDPQSIGGDIPYSTWVLSAGLSRRVYPHVVAGGALRLRTGHVYKTTGNAVITDVGIVADKLTSREIRVAASTFLLSPGSADPASMSIASDVRVAGADTARQVRGGLSFLTTSNGPTERYPFVEGRYDNISVRGGPVNIRAYGNSAWRLRMALLIRHAGYTISLAREDNANGLAATYQLGASRVR